MVFEDGGFIEVSARNVLALEVVVIAPQDRTLHLGHGMLLHPDGNCRSQPQSAQNPQEQARGCAAIIHGLAPCVSALSVIGRHQRLCSMGMQGAVVLLAAWGRFCLARCEIEGKLELDKFIDPEKTYPVIATTSKLMSTEVDAQTKKRNVFTQYGPVARKVLEALLDKYADEGIGTVESNEVFKLQPFTDLGSPVELVRSFGGRPQYLNALQTLERELYAPSQNSLA